MCRSCLTSLLGARRATRRASGAEREFLALCCAACVRRWAYIVQLGTVRCSGVPAGSVVNLHPGWNTKPKDCIRPFISILAIPARPARMCRANGSSEWCRQDSLPTPRVRVMELRLLVFFFALGSVVAVLTAVILHEAHQTREQHQPAKHGVKPQSGALRDHTRQTVSALGAAVRGAACRSVPLCLCPCLCPLTSARQAGSSGQRGPASSSAASSSGGESTTVRTQASALRLASPAPRGLVSCVWRNEWQRTSATHAPLGVAQTNVTVVSSSKPDAQLKVVSTAASMSSCVIAAPSTYLQAHAE